MPIFNQSRHQKPNCHKKPPGFADSSGGTEQDPEMICLAITPGGEVIAKQIKS